MKLSQLCPFDTVGARCVRALVVFICISVTFLQQMNNVSRGRDMVGRFAGSFRGSPGVLEKMHSGTRLAGKGLPLG